MVESKKDNLLSQTQIANKLKVSQATVTRVIKNNGIEPTSTKGRSKLFSSEQVEFIRSYIFHRNEKHSSNVDNLVLSSYFQQEISKLHEQNNRLEEQYINQLKAKDKQIDELNDRLKEAHQLQLGLEQKLKMLPEASKAPLIDSQSNSYNNAASIAKSHENSSDSHRKGLLRRIFHF